MDKDDLLWETINFMRSHTAYGRDYAAMNELVARILPCIRPPEAVLRNALQALSNVMFWAYLEAAASRLFNNIKGLSRSSVFDIRSCRYWVLGAELGMENSRVCLSWKKP